jgi:hypothetical protein
LDEWDNQNRTMKFKSIESIAKNGKNQNATNFLLTILLQWEPKLPGRNAQHKETSAQNVEPLKYGQAFIKI